jgi:hypothetical protein
MAGAERAGDALGREDGVRGRLGEEGRVRAGKDEETGPQLGKRLAVAERVEAVPIDSGAILCEPEETGLRVARLGFRRDTANLDITETEIKEAYAVSTSPTPYPPSIA